MRLVRHTLGTGATHLGMKDLSSPLLLFSPFFLPSPAILHPAIAGKLVILRAQTKDDAGPGAVRRYRVEAIIDRVI